MNSDYGAYPPPPAVQTAGSSARPKLGGVLPGPPSGVRPSNYGGPPPQGAMPGPGGLPPPATRPSGNTAPSPGYAPGLGGPSGPPPSGVRPSNYGGPPPQGAMPVPGVLPPPVNRPSGNTAPSPGYAPGSAALPPPAVRPGGVGTTPNPSGYGQPSSSARPMPPGGGASSGPSSYRPPGPNPGYAPPTASLFPSQSSSSVQASAPMIAVTPAPAPNPQVGFAPPPASRPMVQGPPAVRPGPAPMYSSAPQNAGYGAPPQQYLAPPPQQPMTMLMAGRKGENDELEEKEGFRTIKDLTHRRGSIAPPPGVKHLPPELVAEPVATDMEGGQFSEDDARIAVKEWAKTTWWRDQKFMKEAHIESFHPFTAFVSTLEVFVEARTTSPAHRPYSGGSIDDRSCGVPPKPWDIVKPPPAYFVTQSFSMPLPHTEEVRTCFNCNGSGQVTCPDCSGNGKVVCGGCNGNGRVDESYTVTNADGNTETRTRQVQCGQCSGSGNCGRCGGSGIITCPECNGSGKLVHYTLLIIDWINHVTQDVVREAMSPEISQFLPDDQISAGQGIEILHEREEVIKASKALNGIERVNPAVNAGIDKLITAVHVPSDQLLHQMRLITKQLPVYEVQYRNGSKSQNLWVIGLDRRVYAPKFPIAYRKLVPVMIAIAFIVLGAVAFVIFLAV